MKLEKLIKEEMIKKINIKLKLFKKLIKIKEKLFKKLKKKKQ